jgi:AGZA family xanthine/uracil permease-like MFS transporter
MNVLAALRSATEKLFNLKELRSNIRTEVLAGVTTFMAMAYIIFVNPTMISQTGIDIGSAMMATCIAAGVATIVMGLYANYPIALAPGMGENAFFTYTVCITMGVPWQTALGCVFISGALFVALSLTRMRQAILEAIPGSLRHGIAAGIGLLVALVGFIDSGLVVASPATLVTLGNVTSPPVMLALFGLAVTGALLARNVKGALLWGMLVTAAAGVVLDLINFRGIVSMPPSMAPTFLKMDVAGAWKMGLATVIFIFFFMDVFDTVGTLAGVGEAGGFMKGGKLPRSGRALFSDAVGTCVGAACGTPTVTSYIESAAGISAGGRSGLANIVTGALFLAAVFFAPLVEMIGGGVKATGGRTLYPVTSPALILVGCMMLRSMAHIEWKDYSETVPAFLTVVMMPLSFSIATGVAFGFIAYAAIKLLSGRGREASWLVYLLSALFILRFLYLQALR